MSDLLHTEPQIDREGMLEQMSMARAYLISLADEIPLHVGSAAEASALVNEAVQLGEQIGREADVVRGGTYDDIVPRFTDFAMAWRGFSARLLPIGDLRINRHVGRVRQCGHEIYSLLRIPPPTDATYLRQLATAHQNDVTEWLSDITLHDLASLAPNEQSRLLATAQELQSRIHQFVETANGRPSFNELQSRYRPVHTRTESDRSMVNCVRRQGPFSSCTTSTMVR